MDFLSQTDEEYLSQLKNRIDTLQKEAGVLAELNPEDAKDRELTESRVKEVKAKLLELQSAPTCADERIPLQTKHDELSKQIQNNEAIISELRILQKISILHQEHENAVTVGDLQAAASALEQEKELVQSLSSKGSVVASLITERLESSQQAIDLSLKTKAAEASQDTDPVETESIKKIQTDSLAKARNLLMGQNWEASVITPQTERLQTTSALLKPEIFPFPLFAAPELEVTLTTQSITQLITELVDSIHKEMSIRRASAIISTCRHILSLFQSINESQYVQMIEKITEVAQLCSNDCIFLSSFLIVLGPKIEHRLPSALKGTTFLDLSTHFRRLGEKYLIQSQQHLLAPKEAQPEAQQERKFDSSIASFFVKRFVST